ncbi:MAG: amino acid permease [Firmicutes bacterium]|nr:amino acid permease [Alicyclobacillaceae bacterium]MCL6497897.1 amino acid permease [Bacillota bacterium]
MGIRVGQAGSKTPREKTASHHRAFHRDLNAASLTLLTIGGVMGSGLFLASGLAAVRAGPIILGFYALGAVAMYLEISVLAEMAMAHPAPGSFLTYAAEVLGAGWTFVAGWIFWFSSVLTMSSEVTAAALFTRYWFPTVPVWMWALVYSAGIIALNFLSVRGFGTVEGVMAGVKAAAVGAFIVVGAYFLVRPGPHPALSGWHAFRQWGWTPHGFWSAAPEFLLVLFAYAGTGVIGMAAAETRDPAVTIRAAVRRSVWALSLLYVLSLALVLALVPFSRLSGAESPFTLALHRLPLGFGAGVMNLVLLLAVLSTMNAALYSNVRVLYTLAERGEAPRWLGYLNARGQPVWAIWTSAGLLAGTIALAYVLPHRAYAYLVTATGFQAMFIWLMVCFTHLRYRPHLLRHHPERLRWRMWGFPYTTWFVIALVGVALLASPLAHGELVGALVGACGIFAAAVAWWTIGRPRARRAPASAGP